MAAQQTTIEETVSRIRRFAADRKLLPGTLARKAGLHPNTLRDMQDPTWCPRFDTIKKLEEFIQADAGTPDDTAAFAGNRPTIASNRTLGAAAGIHHPSTISEIAGEIPPTPRRLSGSAASGR